MPASCFTKVRQGRVYHCVTSAPALTLLNASFVIVSLHKCFQWAAGLDCRRASSTRCYLIRYSLAAHCIKLFQIMYLYQYKCCIHRRATTHALLFSHTISDAWFSTHEPGWSFSSLAQRMFHLSFAKTIPSWTNGATEEMSTLLLFWLF